MKKPSDISVSALVLWRQLLNAPVKAAVWDLRTREVQELIAAGMVQIKNDVFPAVVLDLSWQCQGERLSKDDKLLLSILSEKPLSVEDFVKWAEEMKIERPFVLVSRLIRNCMVATEDATPSFVYKLAS